MYIAVVAPYDGTNVEMWRREPNGDYVLDRTTNLEKYQTYHMRSTSEDYTGTYIRSSRPIAVYGGHECALVPTDTNFCDHIVAAIPPVGSLGSTFGIIPLAERHRAGCIVRILAVQGGTSVETNNRGMETLTRGEFWEIDITDDTAMIVTCSHPCLVAQYNKVNNSNISEYTDICQSF